jgi:hypothetical protein
MAAAAQAKADRGSKHEADREGAGRGTQRPVRELDQSNTAWKERIEVSIAKSRKVRGGNYVQIATVDSDGFPHCRTVVFRGFMDVPSSSGSLPMVAMKMISDNRR